MTVLVAWLWQGLAVAAAARLAVQWLPRLSAATRHAMWWMALGVVLLLLMHPWALLNNGLAQAANAGVADTTAPGFAAASVSDAAGVRTTFGWQLPTPPDWAVTVVVCAWCALVVWKLARLGRSLRAVASIKRRSRAFDPAREARLPLWREGQQTGRRCELRVSDDAAGASAFGFARPMIVVESALAERLSDTELDLVLAHERAHIVRRDDWLQLLQHGVLAVFGVHPAIGLIGRQIELERETACDDHVVARTGAAAPYARCLATVAELIAARRLDTGSAYGLRTPTPLSPRMAGHAPLLRVRVARLLNRRNNRTPRIGWQPTAGAALLLAAVALTCDQAPPLVTFADAAQTAPPMTTAAGSRAMPEDLDDHVDRVDHGASTATSGQPSTRSTPAARSNQRPMHPRALASSARTSRVTMAADRSTSERASHAVQTAAIDISTTIASQRPLPATPVATSIDVPPPPAPEVPPPAATSAAGATTPDDEASNGWSAFGAKIAQAGVSVGKGSQHVGQAIGRWFSKPWISDKKTSNR